MKKLVLIKKMFKTRRSVLAKYLSRSFILQRVFFILLFSNLCFKVAAQNTKIDSLKRLLENVLQDSTHVNLLVELSYQYENYKPDTALLLAQQGLMLAREIDYTSGQASCLNMIGLVFMTTGNYPQALQYLLQSLKASEALHDEPSVAAVLENIGVTYAQQQDYRLGVNYQLQALTINRSLQQKRNTAITLLDLGDNYENLNILDSAIYYTNQSYQLAVETENTDLIGIALNNYGNIYSKLGKDSLAFISYRSGIPYLVKEQDDDDLCETYTGLAKLFKKSGQDDSCLYYGRLSLAIAKKAGFTEDMMDACNFLSSFFAAARNYDSAFEYQSEAIVAKDSLFSQEKAREIQALQFDEMIHRQQLVEANERAHTQLKENLLFVGILALLMVSFILYRNNRQKVRANSLLQKQKEEINIQKDKAEKTLTELKSTQAQLIQSEKMASLGELTAGIAHEIQNPLNFVNNFSEVNKELIDELEEEVEKGNIDEAKIIAKDIRENSEKINHHGKRAGDIVKGMLQHSRSSSGVKELTDINKLAEEYLRLAYHGLRAKDKSFNATMNFDFDKGISKINVVPQDIGCVILNLINNAFYAVDEKKKSGIHNYEPTVSVNTNKINDKVEIRVKDNGNGIPQKVIDKIFQPFFTTKPTGVGTGLGLSLSYDIVKAHGGEIKVITVEGEFTEFEVQLPA
jgi:two-component system, NtrC family, sensor kinase